MLKNTQGGGNSLIYSIISPFYVNSFFVVSGYLFFRKWLFVKDENLKYKLSIALKNILYRLIIPTILFATILYLPKMFFHSQDSTINDYLHNVLGGCSFWFTSALTISQLVLLCAIYLRINTLTKLSMLALFLCCLLPVLKMISSTPFPWYYKSGLAASVLMIAGGWLYHIGTKTNHSKQLGYIVVGIYIFLVIIYEYFNIPAKYALMSVTINSYGILLSSLGIISIFIVAKYIKPYSFIQFIGENSIVFYFMSGAIPATLVTIFKNFYGNTWIALFIGFISIICGYAMTKLIVKYMTFLIDLRSYSKNRV